MALAIGFSRLTPWFMKLAIDVLEQVKDRESALNLAGEALEQERENARGLALHYTTIMFTVALLGGIFLYFQRWLLIGTSRRVERELRTDLFKHVQRLDLNFFRENSTGDLMSRFTNDLNALRDVAGPGLMYSLQMTSIILASVGLMLAIDPGLTAVAFIPYPLITLTTYFFGKKIYRLSRRSQDLFGELSSRTQEDISGTRVIRVYNRETDFAARFHEKSSSYMQANLEIARTRAGFVALITALAASGAAIALLMGGNRHMAGDLSLGELVAFTAYLIELIWPVAAIGWVISMHQRGASAMGRLREVFKRKPLIVSGPQPGRPGPEVAFTDVTFSYPGASTPALAGVTFNLDRGQTLGIVGLTGSGKSTLLKLILRFGEPDKGKIALAGKNIQEWSLAELRGMIGYTPQDSFLFSRTLAENIAYGNSSATRAEIEQACNLAQLDEDLEHFPQGLDTLIGERGITLSGGQRQRASLARAYLTNPDLLLLDDTLSSVDARKEEQILRAMQPLLAERTAIIVSHRISAVLAADWILVLAEGRICEEGRHGDLLKNDELYAKLYERQRLAAKLEGDA